MSNVPSQKSGENNDGFKMKNHVELSWHSTGLTEVRRLKSVTVFNEGEPNYKMSVDMATAQGHPDRLRITANGASSDGPYASLNLLDHITLLNFLVEQVNQAKHLGQ